MITKKLNETFIFENWNDAIDKIDKNNRTKKRVEDYNILNSIQLLKTDYKNKLKSYNKREKFFSIQMEDKSY